MQERKSSLVLKDRVLKCRRCLRRGEAAIGATVLFVEFMVVPSGNFS